MAQRDLHLLPREIRLEIVSRLPITSLIRFKITSHAGYDLITDPRLPPMFRNRVSDSDPCLILFDYNFLELEPRQFFFVDSEDRSARVRRIYPPQVPEECSPEGSCNGLLCISFLIGGGSPRSHGLLIYNPIVGDGVRVPLANQFLNKSEIFGFGFHPRTGELKVVRIVYYKKIIPAVDPALDVGEVDEGLATVDESMVQVFTVGTTEWREKGTPPPQFADVKEPPEALVEGSLHWVTVGMGGDGPIFGIISFELADEVFDEIPHPPCQRFVSRRYSLSVLSGCLSAAGLVDTLHFDIWVMKQYHVRESWVKQFSLDPNFPGDGGWPSYSRFPKVICARKNGEILLQCDKRSLVSYDPVENRFTNLQLNGLPNQFQTFPFQPSLFSAEATMNLQF